MANHTLVNTNLILPLTSLVSRLKGTANTEIPLFFAFDEVSNLAMHGLGPKVFEALRRVIRLLRALPVWTFVLSTQSALDSVAPAIENDPSARVIKGLLQRHTAFCEFPLNVEAGRRLWADWKRQLSLPLDNFATISHILSFGRPLWMGYIDGRSEVVRPAVMYKLLGGRKYNPSEKNQLLAVLANRIALDPCTQTSESIGLEREAVQSHLRWMLSLDQRHGFVETTSQSEPVLAEAAAWVLMETGEAGDHWEASIDSLFVNLMSPGLIDRGRTGELVARLLCVLARDRVLHGTADDEPIRLKYAQSYGVIDFLQSLFRLPESILSGTVKKRGGKPTIRTSFASASMNFTHFATTDRPLSPSSVRELLYSLMSRQAALQLCSNQPFWDLLIPIYLGKRDEKFDLAKLTALLIQVKNSQKKNKYDVLKEHYVPLFGRDNPIITIMLDLGIGKDLGIDTVKSFASSVFALTATGAGGETYNCITSERMKATLSQILNLPANERANYRRDISDVNTQFRRHALDEQFPEELYRARDGTTPGYSPGDETVEAVPGGQVQRGK